MKHANQTPTVLEAIDQVYKLTQNKGAPSVASPELKKWLAHLQDYFQLSALQSLYAAVMFALDWDDRPINQTCLTRHFDCRSIEVLKDARVFKELEHRAFFKKEEYNRSKPHWRPNEGVVLALMENAPLPQQQNLPLHKKGTKTSKLNLLNSLWKRLGNSEQCNPDAHEIETELKPLQDYFGLNKTQTYLASLCYAIEIENRSYINIRTICQHLDCNLGDVLYYSVDWQKLEEMELLKLKSGNTILDKEWKVNPQVLDALVTEQPFPSLQSTKPQNVVELLCLLDECVENLIYSREDSPGILHYQAEKITKILEANKSFDIAPWLQKLPISTIERMILIQLVVNSLEGNPYLNIERKLSDFNLQKPRQIHYLTKFNEKESELFKHNLVELSTVSFFNRSELILSDQGMDKLETFGLKFKRKDQNKDKGLIYPEDIVAKKLYFPKQEMQQIHTLDSLLRPTKFTQMQERLAEKGLPKGVVCLLHGAPGTGKTEVAKQLARKTKRPLMKVEISQAKSMWFGESEKAVKRIFEDYKRLAKTADRTPILLFNEADAIISKRKSVNSSSVAQTENAIQNILLEEMENFEGILLATTNLVSNIDSAFERRFLFKVQFDKPTTETRAKIWKLKLPKFTPKQCAALAAEFPFTGGQMDNVVRKLEIEQILHATAPSLAQTRTFCKQESMQSSTAKPMGFSTKSKS